ncbi:S1C family serine protease [Actinoallomurus iriomotensis]|uniref:Protease n=1 Tax=Actinoallomurus iriomotensis TaxID=478107 RepID=A0A9W6VYC1_9ACTN|nr:trypsin-like peptidase domain-containing protein [Actinoallomurus iriomotensis]GLY84710.1 protease [Actinoallomurus iriomotensis]
MTEDNRAPGGPPQDDRRTAEFEPRNSVGPQGPTDQIVAGGPPSGPPTGPQSGLPIGPPSGPPTGPQGMAPPDPGPRSPYGAPQHTDALGRPRPSFSPHHYEQPYDQQRHAAPSYNGWNTQQQPHPPQPPGGGYPAQPGPNWAPVPAPEPRGRRGPSTSLFLVVSVVIALLAGALGAGVGVLATGDHSGTVDLGSGKTSTTGAKNRDPGSVAGIAQRLVPSVVMIKVTNGTEGGAGTGFVVNGGYIVTNNHVVAPAVSGGNMQVVFSDGKTTTATIVGHDPTSDIAVIKPGTLAGRKALTLGDSDNLAVGDPVIAIGSPLGLAGTVTTGIVSALNRPVSTSGEGGESAFINAVQTDAAINPGNSGGPLVDSKGQVIGVNSAIATLGSQSLGDKQQSGSIGLGFAIPSNQVKKVAEQLINNGKATHAVIGACIDMSYQGGGARIATDGAQSCKGGTITAGGPAEKAGLKAGDIITAFDGKPISGSDELIMAIRAKAPGDRVQVAYTRGSQRSTTVLTLGAGN